MKRKPKFKVGQVLWCEYCHCKAGNTEITGYTKVTSIVTRAPWGLLYGLNGEDPNKDGQGHIEMELRPLTKKEAGR